MSNTVWDVDPSAGTPRHDKVTGQTPQSGGVLELLAGISVQLGGLTAQVKRNQDRYDKIARSIPGDPQVAVGGIYPASGVLYLNLGSPDQGTFWNVRDIIIGGSDITTTPAGTGWVVVGGSPGNANGANTPLTNVRDFTHNPLPQVALYGDHELVVDETEYLSVIVTGGTAGVQYVASAKVESFNRGTLAEGIFTE